LVYWFYRAIVSGRALPPNAAIFSIRHWELFFRVSGPYHSYCKGIQGGEILQCMLFKTTAPDARMVAVEYFIAKDLA